MSILLSVLCIYCALLGVGIFAWYSCVDVNENCYNSFIVVKDRCFRAISTFGCILWASGNCAIGLLMLLMKKGIVTEFVDLHTPPMRHIYIAATILMVGAFAITVLFYATKYRVCINKKSELSPKFHIMGNILTWTPPTLIVLTLMVSGVLGMLGLFDVSYHKDIIRKAIIGLAIATACAIVVYFIIRWIAKYGFRIIKDVEEYIDENIAYKTASGKIYYPVLSERRFWGRVYTAFKLTESNELSACVIPVKRMDIIVQDAEKVAVPEKISGANITSYNNPFWERRY